MQVRHKIIGVAASAALLGGGALGGSVLNATAASTAPAAATAPTGTAEAPHSGKFHPNTNPAHEAAESQAHAAQEAAGQFPTAP